MSASKFAEEIGKERTKNVEEPHRADIVGRQHEHVTVIKTLTIQHEAVINKHATQYEATICSLAIQYEAVITTLKHDQKNMTEMSNLQISIANSRIATLKEKTSLAHHRHIQTTVIATYVVKSSATIHHFILLQTYTSQHPSPFAKPRELQSIMALKINHFLSPP